MSWLKRFLGPSLRSPSAVAIAFLAAAFLLAYTSDAALEHLRNNAATTFDFRPVVIISAVAPLILVAGILALAWIVLRRLPPNRFTAIVFIVAGVVVVVGYLSFLVGFPLWLRNTIIGRFRYDMMDFGPQSSTYLLASACIIIGFAALRRLRNASRETKKRQ
jgi:putative exporter of polyketide antibiotics